MGSRREIDEASPTSILTARGIDVRKRALQDVTRQMNNTKSPANRTKAARVVPTDLSMKAKDATRQKKSKKLVHSQNTVLKNNRSKTKAAKKPSSKADEGHVNGLGGLRTILDLR